jgi:hypothetical protein
MVAFSDDAAAIWRKVAAIEWQIAEETQYLRERLSQLEGERDELLLKLLNLEVAHDRRLVGVALAK